MMIWITNFCCKWKYLGRPSQDNERKSKEFKKNQTTICLWITSSSSMVSEKKLRFQIEKIKQTNKKTTVFFSFGKHLKKENKNIDDKNITVTVYILAGW